jgi:beta-lactamase regulating signal transducer with metallopeptidase domain
LLENIFAISLSTSVVILLLLLIAPFLQQRYSAKWRYVVWLIIAFRLVIPFRLELPTVPVQIPLPVITQAFYSPDATPVSPADPAPALTPSPSSDPALMPMATGETAARTEALLLPLENILLAVWALGALTFFSYHLLAYRTFQRRIQPYCRATDSALLDGLLASMKIKTRVSLRFCSRITSPMMTGFFKPAILLPETAYTDAELVFVLRHELTHFQRRDLWYKLLLVAANSLHFFNPLVYLLVRQANRDLEHSCDDAVLRDSDLSFRKEYSLTILKFMQPAEQPPFSAHLSGDAADAEKRSARMTAPTRRQPSRQPERRQDE